MCKNVKARAAFNLNNLKIDIKVRLIRYKKLTILISIAEKYLKESALTFSKRLKISEIRRLILIIPCKTEIVIQGVLLLAFLTSQKQDNVFY